MAHEFEWDLAKQAVNIEKHGVDFVTAAKAFADPNRKILMDFKHSEFEERFYCIAKLGKRIINVRFVMRGKRIRIIGAGYWRNGVKYYEEKEI